MIKFMHAKDLPAPTKAPVIDHSDTSIPWDTITAPTPAIDVDSWRAGAKFMIVTAKGFALSEEALKGITDTSIKERDRLMALKAPTMAEYAKFVEAVKALVQPHLDVEPELASIQDIYGALCMVVPPAKD